MSDTIHHYDIVVIGSGAGGGTVAQSLSSLCASGARIALLEWGGRFRKQDNTREELVMAQKYYFDRGGFQTVSQDVTLAFAKAVGGSTTVYTGTSLQIPEEVLQKWNVPGLNFKDLQPRYAKYLRENNVHLLPEAEISTNNRFFREGCQKLGWKVIQFPVNTRDCLGLATCNLGCAAMAKQGTAVVQIPAAEQAGVQVIPFCRVDRIEDHDVVAEVLEPEHGLAPSPLPVGRHRFRAKRIVVAAGAVHSPALLRRSFGERLSPVLGRYFTCHPALILMGEHPAPIQNTQGHPKSYYCDQFMETERFLLETCMYFPFTVAKSLAGFGPEMDRMMSRFSHLQMILSLAMDEAIADNRVDIDREGNPVVHYRLTDKTVGSLVQSIRAAARIFFARGAVRMHSPASEKFTIEQDEADRIDELIDSKFFLRGKVSVSAAHLMGGCRMGRDSDDSVTDAWGRVHERPYIYVADASLFPAASEVNPYLTIMALADRVAEAVKKDLAEVSR